MEKLVGLKVHIPESILYKNHGAGKIIRQWNDTIEVEFSLAYGRKCVGHYTISKHEDMWIEN